MSIYDMSTMSEAVECFLSMMSKDSAVPIVSRVFATSLARLEIA